MRRLLALVFFVSAVACREERSAEEQARAQAAFDRYRRPDLLTRALELRGGEKILDVGAGDGYLTIPLANAVGPKGQVLAIDVDEAALEKLEDRLPPELDDRVQTKLVAPDDPALGAQRFDLILLSEVDHLLPDRAAYLSRLKTNLAEGGKIAVANKRGIRAALLQAAGDAGLLLRAEHDDLPAHFLLIFGVSS